ncbi:MAG: LptF/LptG family permease [Bacteroidales bacterium]|nr:LptF/LptG family permease [Candidatus Cryptobacteroides aphodequi]
MKNLYIKKIDWYIFKRFITSFLVSLVLIIGIVIIFDISEKIDDFVKNEASLHDIIFNYYLNFIPYFANMFSPLFVFITVIFFTSRMAANSEIIAILSGGVSFHRMMVPYLAAAALIAASSLALSLFVIPNSNATRVEFEQTYIKYKATSKTKNIHYQIAPGQFVFVESFSNWNKTAYKFTLESIEDNRLTSKLSAESAVWDSTMGGWHLRRYFIRDYAEGLGDVVRSGEKLDTVIALTIDDFYFNQKTVETLPIGKLNDLIETQKMRGDAQVMFSEIEKHTRFALPFSAFILTLMGVSLSSKKRRGGIGLNLGLGIGLAFSYILFLRFSQMFVFTGALPPAIALWLPNVLFAIITGVLYKLAPK